MGQEAHVKSFLTNPDRIKKQGGCQLEEKLVDFNQKCLPYRDMSFKQFKFAEELPESCPNGDASQVQRTGFWRFVMVKYREGVSGTDEKAFSSQHGRGQPCPTNKNPCDWASCSLFDEDRAKKMAKI
jgi:hypothetical protein